MTIAGVSAGIARAPVAAANDAQAISKACAALRTSPTGSLIIDRLAATSARICVASDDEFAGIGHARAHAFYEPRSGTVFLRRSMCTDPSLTGVAIAHEATHLLDDVAMVTKPYVGRVNAGVDSVGGASTRRGAKLLQHAALELTLIRETRAFTVAGIVARDLGVECGDDDPTAVAAAGANEPATYERVWNALLDSPYNPGGQQLEPRWM